MRLLVTGASGLLGLNLSLVAAAQNFTVIGLVHSRELRGAPFETQVVNLLDQVNAQAQIKAIKPDAIIHCAAVANLNAAESEPELTHTLNAVVPGRLAAAAFRWGVPFVHISTDAVFDGRTGGYSESDLPNPLSVYAQSKLAGEIAVQEANPDSLIARVVFYGWSLSGKRSLSEFFFNNLQAGTRIKGFTDTLFCPLYVEDLSQVLVEMLTAGLKGVYHVVSPDSLSKYDFGVRIAEKFGFDPSLIEPVRMQVIQREAARSLNLVLKTNKAQTALGHALPSVEGGLERLFQRWQGGYPEQLQNFAV